MPPVNISKPDAVSSVAGGDVSGSRAEGASSRQSQGAGAIQAARQKVAADPTNWRCLNELGMLYSMARLYDDAIIAFEQALALHPITTTIESERKQQAAINAQHEAMVQQKKVQQEAQNNAAMNQLFSGLLGSIASMPGVDQNTLALMPVINASMSVASQTDMSMIITPKQDVESQIKSKMEVADIYYNLGMAQFEKGSYSDSILSLENSFSLNPSRSEILWRESEACFLQASYHKAINLMNRYLAIGVTSPAPSVFIRMADAFRALGLDSEADKALRAGIDEYKRRIVADSENTDTMRELARIYVGQDLYDDAGKYLEAILARNESADVRLELAAVQLCRLHLEEAWKSMQKVLNGLGSEAPYAWYIVGRIYDEQGNAAEALKAYRKGVDLLNCLPDGGRAFSYGSILRAVAGQPEQAKKELETSLASDPNGTKAYTKLFHLGIVYEKTGDDVYAIEVLNRALLLRPRYPLIASALSRLEKKNSGKCSSLLAEAESAASKKDFVTAVKAYSSAFQLMASGPLKQNTLQRIMKLAAEMETPLPMTPEAQRYYLRGNAALKSAKTPVDLDRAIFEYRWASLYSPWAAPVYLNASVAYGVRLRYGEAMDALKMFLTISPNAKNVEEALTKLAELEYQQETSLRSLSFQGVVR